MKIAILTLPLHTNYGGLLQAYALQSALERMGYEVSVLDKIRKPKVQIPFSVSVKRLIMKFILRKNVAPIGQLEDYKRRKKAKYEYLEICRQVYSQTRVGQPWFNKGG